MGNLRYGAALLAAGIMTGGSGCAVFRGAAGSMMAPVAGLSDADLDNLVAFIRSLKQ